METKHTNKIVWKNVILMSILHLLFLYSIYVMLFEAKWQSSLWMYLYGVCTGLGITAGAHRLWSHRAFKANLPLKVLLVIFQTGAMQDSVFEWARNHRVHHRFSDTDADPHNIKRGFFFSHMGWLFLRKHQDVFTKGKTVDVSDMLAEPLLVFQHKYYLLLTPFSGVFLPMAVGYYVIGDTLWNSFLLAGVARYVFVLHITWLINSLAHTYGNKPFDKTITPADSPFLGFWTLGEGWHNYHHVFPGDYRTGDLGNAFSWTRYFIHFMAKIGWAYDLKTVADSHVLGRVQKTGDGTSLLDLRAASALVQ